MDLFAPRIKTTLASLRAQLPARIDAFNGEANGVTLDKPADDGDPLSPRRPGLGYVFGGMPQYAGSEFPVIEAAIPDGLLDQLDIGQQHADLDSSLVVAVWAGRTAGEDFPTLYEKVLGYARCVTETLMQPNAIWPSEEVARIRFAFAANPDRRARDEMQTYTFGGFMFISTRGLEARP